MNEYEWRMYISASKEGSNTISVHPRKISLDSPELAKNNKAILDNPASQKSYTVNQPSANRILHQ